MKIFEYLDINWGVAFKRISAALHSYAPKDVVWAGSMEDSDVVLVHVVGGGEATPIEKALSLNKPVVIVQHTYFTSGYNGWDNFWEKSLLTLSFHDLASYTDKKFPFLHTPWGAEPRTFKRLPQENRYLDVFTTGHVAYSECIDKLYLACEKAGKVMFHTGEDFRFGKNYKFLPYMSDPNLVMLLNRVHFVSCLREHEGFEMMGVEGLFCGARPIVPNIDTYNWYSKYGYTIDMKSDIVSQLADILTTTPEPVSESEDKEIHYFFDWDKIIGDIYHSIYYQIG